MSNLKLMFRRLINKPFITAVAVISLGLGIGANAAIFSLFEQILFRPLPVAQPERLVNLSAPGPSPGPNLCNIAGGCWSVFSYAMLRDLQLEQEVFVDIAGHRSIDANLAIDGLTLSGQVMMVSGSYFPVLGIQPALGRLLGPADDRTIGANFVAVLSYGYWQDQIGGDPDIIGQRIVINGHPMAIIGVAPREFEGTTLGVDPSVYVPISMAGQIWRGFNDVENRGLDWLYLFARLKPGVTMMQAEAGINSIYRSIINEVEAPILEGLGAQTMARFRAKEIVLSEGDRGQSSIHERTRTPLILSFFITGIVLLIACANIANLLLVRAATRQREFRIRLALGASRRHLVAQLLIESCLLAVIGGIASLAFAQWTLAGIGALLPAEIIPTLDFRLNLSVLLFTAGLAIGTGLLFGIFPALQSTRQDPGTTIRPDTGHPSGARTAARLRSSLVVTQIALSMALLVSAGLFIRGIVNLNRIDLGLEPGNVVTFGLSPALNGYESARTLALFERVEEEFSMIPGVTSVAASGVRLLAHGNWGTDVTVEGSDVGPEADRYSRFNLVSPGYFRTLGISLLAGRAFTTADDASAPRVAIVNEAFARKFNLGRDVIGKYIGDGDKPDIRIVGLVQDAKYSSATDQAPPQYFLPYRQGGAGSMYFYIRTSLSPESLIRRIPDVIAELDPNLPLKNLMTLPMQVRQNTILDRIISTLASAFAALATLLAAIGLYGVLAYTVAQQTREIGVRMALGADRGHVRLMVLKRVAVMLAVGGVVGIVAALGLGRLAGSLLYEVEGHDPLAIIAATIVLALVALGAGYLPARQASRIEPMEALRFE
jgi:predicted permease